MRRTPAKTMVQAAGDAPAAVLRGERYWQFLKQTWLACGALLCALRNRRDTLRLLELDDHELADIGLKRTDVSIALASPLHHDPSSILREARDERRLARAQVRSSWTDHAP